METAAFPAPTLDRRFLCAASAGSATGAPAAKRASPEVDLLAFFSGCSAPAGAAGSAGGAWLARGMALGKVLGRITRFGGLVNKDATLGTAMTGGGATSSAGGPQFGMAAFFGARPGDGARFGFGKVGASACGPAGEGARFGTEETRVDGPLPVAVASATLVCFTGAATSACFALCLVSLDDAAASADFALRLGAAASADLALCLGAATSAGFAFGLGAATSADFALCLGAGTSAGFAFGWGFETSADFALGFGPGFCFSTPASDRPRPVAPPADGRRPHF